MPRETRENPQTSESSKPDEPEILVVDDDPKNLVAIEAALRDFDGKLDMVRSGSEALHNLLEREYALILLDIHMPDLDGFETAKLIRRRAKTKHLPIIFITAYDQSDSRVLEGYELGAVDFLFKPIEPAILRAKVNVFAELTRRTREVASQAEQLWMHERREALARLEQERQSWERENLRREMQQQRVLAEETQARAEQLAEIAAQRELAQNELARINARLAEEDRRKNHRSHGASCGHGSGESHVHPAQPQGRGSVTSGRCGRYGAVRATAHGARNALYRTHWVRRLCGTGSRQLWSVHHVLRNVKDGARACNG